MAGKAAEKNAGTLFDILSEGDLRSGDIINRAGLSYYQFMKAVQKLRDILAANGDVISVVSEPQQEQVGGWLYGLRAGKVIVDAEKSQWVINRLQDTERRVTTILHVLDVACNSLDGRTIEGKKARIYQLHMKRAQEEVALISE